MITTAFLNQYLENICRLARAQRASLFLTGFAENLLQHSADEPALAELADEAHAASTLAELTADLCENGSLMKPAASGCGLLVVVSIGADHGVATQVVTERRNFVPSRLGETETHLMIGLGYARPEDVPAFGDNGLVEPLSQADWILSIIVSSGGPLSMNWELSRILKHPVTGLAGRVELERVLPLIVHSAQESGQPVSLMFVNPDHFEQVNHRFGRPQGDLAVRELASLLRASLRESDLLFHYSGAIFAIVLPATDEEGARSAANKVRSAVADRLFIDGVLPLTVSIGVSGTENGSVSDTTELIRRTDSALNMAKLAGGARTVLWQENSPPHLPGPIDRGSAIFTADAIKDYRNMSLLWELMSGLATQREISVIARELTSRIAKAFRLELVALYSALHQEPDSLTEEPLLLSACRYMPEHDTILNEPVVRAEKPVAMVRQVRETGEQIVHREENRITEGVLPMVARDDLIGFIYLENGPEATLDNKDMDFLAALVAQVAMSLDRAELLNRWMKQQQEESKKLREEVRELRQAVKQIRLVYQSAAMETLMQRVQKIALSDATVLITGESGTGKEMLGHAIHDLSDRRQRPFVTVDCGAISPGLVEAELFGRVKGAFTGADTATDGYIQQAHGGTLFLDEIGELPIEVQTRLLRFVQEKTVTPVGSSSSVKVDVRIIAATNRDLLEEVKFGGFRSDLYYRLQVVTLESPPLRDRSEDILPLANFFVEKFSLSYQKPELHLAPETRDFLQTYHWPGNVRELQNTMLRAVLMSDGPEIRIADLDIESRAARPAAAQEEVKLPGVLAASMERRDLWRELTLALEAVLDECAQQTLPMGRWLTEALLITANEISDGVTRRGATVLGMAESTFRRQVAKSLRSRELEHGKRPEGWEAVESVSAEIVREQAKVRLPAQQNLVVRTRDILLAVVDELVGSQYARGAALMDVTTPTYKSWLERLESAGGR
ncbi:MAG: sigma 54-interacting transcriptional regulator [Pseudomonadales bacterium]|nr:sigma 54-interacting transcriptional regulator [Pseudomonadales bacterium]